MPTPVNEAPSKAASTLRLTPMQRLERDLTWHKSFVEQQKAENARLQQACEHFLEANRVTLDLLGELIPKLSPDTAAFSRLGIIEDILDGANVRYTE